MLIRHFIQNCAAQIQILPGPHLTLLKKSACCFTVFYNHMSLTFVILTHDPRYPCRCDLAEVDFKAVSFAAVNTFFWQS